METSLKLTFAPAVMADADALLMRGARQADWRECFKATGGSLSPALRFSVARSDLAVAVRSAGKIIVLFGVGADAAGQGAVWLVAHPDAEHPDLIRNLARTARRFVDCWQRQFDVLHNVVDPDNTIALRWISWLGFVIDRDKPVRGPLGHTLLNFRRTQACVQSSAP